LAKRSRIWGEKGRRDQIKEGEKGKERKKEGRKGGGGCRVGKRREKTMKT
jgi:hypothetical protein